MHKHCLPALFVLVKKPAIYCMALILLLVESSHHAVHQLKSLQSPLSFGEDGPPLPKRQNRGLSEITGLPTHIKEISNGLSDVGGENIASSDKEDNDEDDDDDDSGDDDDDLSSDEEYISSVPRDIVNFGPAGAPSCFAQVIVQIWPRPSTSPSSNVADCEGLLLADDLVLTSAYCAATAASVQIPVIRANKTVALLATTAIGDDRHRQQRPLGLLKVDLPSYHRNSGIPRKRMFLGSGRKEGATSGPLECQKERPIASALPIADKLIPVAPVRNILSASHVLWDDDIDSSAELTNGKRKWWVARQSRQILAQAIRDLGKKWRAPLGSSAGGVDIDNPDNIGALLDAEDPRGHRFHMCFSLYHRRWMEQEPFSGIPFFDWLDFGSGKNITPVDLDVHPELRNRGWGIDCPKEKFNDRKLHYLNLEERKQYAVDLTPYQNGQHVRVTYRRSGAPIDDEAEVYLYVLSSLDQTLYVIPDAHPTIGHSTLIASEPALAAGELLIGKRGKLEEVDFGSGHYRGGVSSFVAMHNWMVDLGLNTTSIEFELRSAWNVTARSKRVALGSGRKISYRETTRSGGGGEVILLEK